MATNIIAVSEEMAAARADLTAAICRFIGRDAIIDTMEINLQTRYFDYETCILLANTIGTPYEKPVMSLAHGGFDNKLIAYYVTLLPKHSPHGQWTLNAYFKALTAFRSWSHNLTTYNCDRVHRVLDTAIDYLDASGNEILPESTERWHMLINFCRAHPHLRSTLLDRIPLSGEIVQETLDLLLESPTASLSDGTL